MSSKLKATRQLLPFIPAILETIELLIPESGKGAEKLRAALDLVMDLFISLGDLGAKWDEVKPGVERAIAILVALANLTGKFKKA